MNKSHLMGAVCACLSLITIPTHAAPMVYEVSFTNTIGAGDFADGIGQITWDSSTQTMTQFEWDFLEGAEPGMAANWLTESWLTSAFLGGTYGSALWELITGEDVFPDPIAQVTALEADGALYTNNGFPGVRAEFYPNGGYIFVSHNEEVVAEGTMSLAPTYIPLPAAVWLFGAGLLGLVGMARRKKAV